MPRFRKNSHLSAALQVGMASAIMDLAIKESMMTEPDKKPEIYRGKQCIKRTKEKGEGYSNE